MTKKWLSLLLVAAVIIGGLLSVGLVQFTGSAAAAPGQCNLQGAWVSSFYGPWDKPLVMQETISPLDPAGKRLVYVMRLVNPDPSFGFPFSPFTETESMSDLIGEAVRTGRDTYDFSLIGYGTRSVPGDRGDILYIWTVTGTMTCIDDQNKTDDVYIAVYDASQDADLDGFPDEGQEPLYLCAGPGPLSAAQRVQQMPACVPSPPP